MRVEQLASDFIVSENNNDVISGAADFFRCTLDAENNGNRFTIPRLQVVERVIVAGGAGTTIKIMMGNVVVHTLQLDENGEASLAPHGNLLLNTYITFLEANIVLEDMRQPNVVTIVGLIVREGLCMYHIERTRTKTKVQLFDGLTITLPNYYVEVGQGNDVMGHCANTRIDYMTRTHHTNTFPLPSHTMPTLSLLRRRLVLSREVVEDVVRARGSVSAHGNISSWPFVDHHAYFDCNVDFAEGGIRMEIWLVRSFESGTKTERFGVRFHLN